MPVLGKYSVLQGAMGSLLCLEDFYALAEKLYSWRCNPVINTKESNKDKGRILGFVKGLRLSAEIAYIIRSILSSEDYKGVIFNFTTDNLTITTTNPDIGESKEEMNIDYKKEPIKVMFNPRYFIETLNLINKDIIQLNIVDDEKPCLIQGENDDTYLSVIMPMRI